MKRKGQVYQISVGQIIIIFIAVVLLVLALVYVRNMIQQKEKERLDALEKEYFLLECSTYCGENFTNKEEYLFCITGCYELMWKEK